jgi:Rieske Fe-S protein
VWGVRRAGRRRPHGDQPPAHVAGRGAIAQALLLNDVDPPRLLILAAVCTLVSLTTIVLPWWWARAVLVLVAEVAVLSWVRARSRSWRWKDAAYVATGFKKWGMTAGTLAGMLIVDAIVGRENPWAAMFSSTRVKPLAEGPRFLTENSRVGMRFFVDRLVARGTRDISDLATGEGGIVSSGGRKVAGYRDDDGVLHAVSTRCTHLGCQVAWNAAERSWDCPCHGSRLTPDGEILDGPATKPLTTRRTQES